MTTIPTYVRWLIGGILPVVALLIGLTTVLVNRSTTRREHALDLMKWSAERAVEPQNALRARTCRSRWGLVMTDRIVVTPAQVTAAKMQVRLAQELGKTVSPLVRRIAEATPRPRNRRDETVSPDAEVQPAGRG